jgi:serine/threonine-protein kinase
VHEIDDFVFFAMAYVEGETLGARVRGKGPLPPRDAARILREVSWALAYAHAQGVVHRDVKPDNILLEARSGRALVSDFGIAHLSADAGLAPTGDVTGTAEFMSPEQARGEAVDERSDLYSLGVVGHYVPSGRLPFQGATAAATLSKHLTQPAPPLASVAPGLPAPLTHAVDRCLAKEPAQRFADGEALADALGAALEERREVPMALRLFMKQNRESTATMVAMEVFPLAMLVLMAVIFMLAGKDFGSAVGPLITTSIVVLSLASTPIATLVQMTRRLLRSGYDHGDLLRAMRDDLEAQRGELASTYGSESTGLDRWLKRRREARRRATTRGWTSSECRGSARTCRSTRATSPRGSSRCTMGRGWCFACPTRWGSSPSGSTVASTTRRPAGRGAGCGPRSARGPRSTWRAARAGRATSRSSSSVRIRWRGEGRRGAAPWFCGADPPRLVHHPTA